VNRGAKSRISATWSIVIVASLWRAVDFNAAVHLEDGGGKRPAWARRS
jgi:hypothetical protein